MADIDRQQLDDVRDRLARAEQNHTNLHTNFRDFKVDTQDQFKEINDKLDEVKQLVGDIRMVMAKWLGGGIVLMGVVQFAADHLLK
jgi:hypothetical protein